MSRTTTVSAVLYDAVDPSGPMRISGFHSSRAAPSPPVSATAGYRFGYIYGRASANRRRMATASSLAARPSARRLNAPNRKERL